MKLDSIDIKAAVQKARDAISSSKRMEIKYLTLLRRYFSSVIDGVLIINYNHFEFSSFPAPAADPPSAS